eukprot:CAMPEP_0194144028 /NCGR_PEP_ID=MMETSP0152-20130528/13122_1 /TAXON_ID=1049557 /ORGANISM="Thalassiothrix antarctica, Strain L6-D1" /LENGTH=60 /DNA_ID=CAMNT_0038843697 /DNA_START=214 /DNA_END=393 /DNA_ORIENTATION=+
MTCAISDKAGWDNNFSLPPLLAIIEMISLMTSTSATLKASKNPFLSIQLINVTGSHFDFN